MVLKGRTPLIQLYMKKKAKTTTAILSSIFWKCSSVHRNHLFRDEVKSYYIVSFISWCRSSLLFKTQASERKLFLLLHASLFTRSDFDQNSCACIPALGYSTWRMTCLLVNVSDILSNSFWNNCLIWNKSYKELQHADAWS